MFNFRKPKKIKALASNSFLSQMETIQEIKSNTNKSAKIDQFNNNLEMGFEFLVRYINSEEKKIPLLEKSGQLFVDALKIKKSQAEPYFYLANVFYLLNDKSKANNYLSIAVSLKPGLKGFSELQEQINELY